MAAKHARRGRFRGLRPRNGRTKMDRHAGRPDLRLELTAASIGGGVCQRRRAGEIHARFCGGVGQSDEPGPFRPGQRVGSTPAWAFDSQQPDQRARCAADPVFFGGMYPTTGTRRPA